MRLSTKGEYASRAMLELALRFADGPQHIRDISSAQDIPDRFLEQILLQLKRAGYLRSRKGPQGGYRLSRPPAEISVAEVIRVMDGPLAPIDCVSVTAHEVCPKEDGCVLKGLWKETRDAIAAILERTTLADLVDRSRTARRAAAPRKGGRKEKP
jgi:Rrf2 family transcriptional regulator, cysteine metabolism repressor